MIAFFALRSTAGARRAAGQPPTAPMGGGFSPARGLGLPLARCIDRKDKASGSGAALCIKANP